MGGQSLDKNCPQEETQDMYVKYKATSKLNLEENVEKNIESESTLSTKAKLAVGKVDVSTQSIWTRLRESFRWVHNF